MGRCRDRHWQDKIGRTVVAGLFVISIAGCSLVGGGVESVSVDSKSPVAIASATPAVIALTNDNWDLAVKDADHYRGSSVNITGQIFYVIGDYEGASHYQLFTNPQDQTGNSHLAVSLDGPKLTEKDVVHVVGTLDHMLVTTSRGGDQLRIPYVIASTVDVLSGPVATVTAAAALATPVVSPSPTAPPPTPTVLTPTATLAVPTATAVPPTATAVPPTATSAPPPATAITPTVTSVPATATKAPATATRPPSGTPSPTPTGSLSLEASLATFTTAGAMSAASDPSAPSGQYLTSSKSATGWNGTSTIPSDAGAASFNVAVPNSGRYALWVRMQYQNVDANSVWLVVDNQKAILVGNEASGYGQWRWVGWRDGNTGSRIAVDLSGGNHTVTIVGREAGTRFDDVLITNDMNQRLVDPAPPATPVSSGDQPAVADSAPPSANTSPPSAAAQSTVGNVASSPLAQATLPPSPSPTSGVILASATPTPTAASTATPTSGSYTVQPGDNLSAIAQRVYGDAGQYPRIFAANRDKLSSPDHIVPGMQLRIPR